MGRLWTHYALHGLGSSVRFHSDRGPHGLWVSYAYGLIMRLPVDDAMALVCAFATRLLKPANTNTVLIHYALR